MDAIKLTSNTHRTKKDIQTLILELQNSSFPAEYLSMSVCSPYLFKSTKTVRKTKCVSLSVRCRNFSFFILQEVDKACQPDSLKKFIILTHFTPSVDPRGGVPRMQKLKPPPPLPPPYPPPSFAPPPGESLGLSKVPSF